MLSEAELQKKWESLTFTDDFIFSRVMRDENRIITVEMQTGHKKELPRRSRYYQSVADVSTTPTGAKYRKLPDNILIFICTFDPFDRNFSRYTFEYTCKESNHQLKLEDGTIRIF